MSKRQDINEHDTLVVDTGLTEASSVLTDEELTSIFISPGEMLANARKQANIPLVELARRLCLSKTVIENIEEDRFDKLAAPTFVRGYLRSYAKLVGVSADIVIKNYNRMTGSQGENAPLKPTVSHVRPQLSSRDSRVKWTSYALIILLLLLVMLWWRTQAPGANLAHAVLPSSTKSQLTPIVEEGPVEALLNASEPSIGSTSLKPQASAPASMAG